MNILVDTTIKRGVRADPIVSLMDAETTVNLYCNGSAYLTADEAELLGYRLQEASSRLRMKLRAAAVLDAPKKAKQP